MNRPGRLARGLTLLVILAMTGFAAAGFLSLRRDLDTLQDIGRDNILWSSSQVEIELLRFRRALVLLGYEGTEAALDDVRERFDILWSRVGLMDEGRVGALMRAYDEGHGTLVALASLMREVDPVLATLAPDDIRAIDDIADRFGPYQRDMRLYTLRVVRGDTEAAAAVRERMRTSTQLAAGVSLGAVLICMLSIVLLMRESARQRASARGNHAAAAAAEASTRAKSRFLTMMSHELRTPLNGVLGPLALLGQSELGERQNRLVAQAQQSGRAMLAMLSGVLDYSDLQDDRVVLKREPFRPSALADQIRSGLRELPLAGEPRLDVVLAPDMPELVWGDQERLRQIFLHFCEHFLSPGHPHDLVVSLRHDGAHLVGEIAVTCATGEVDWKLDLLTGMSEATAEPFTSEALGPLVARGLLASAHGVLSLDDGPDGARVVRVLVPAEIVAFDKIRVHLETRSTALETLYRAALRSDRVVFNPPGAAGPADIVLVDATSVGEATLAGALRARYPGALFVSLGLPDTPAFFDDIVEAPHDLARLRRSVLGRLAS